MQKSYATIREFTISEVSADAGRSKPTKDFHVIKCEELPLNERMFSPSRSDHFSIVLVTSGQCTFRKNLIEYSLKKNSLIIISPGAIRYIQEKTEDLGGVLLEFTKDFLGAAELHKKHIDAFTFFSSQSDSHLTLSETEAIMLYDLLLLLRQKDLQDTEHPFRQEVIHHSFNLVMFEMGGLFKKYKEASVTRLTHKEGLLINFTKLLAQHFKEERTVQYYADQLFVTPKHLTKTVKEITNKTGGEFIDDMVISEAKILLDDPNMSVGDVADALHFSDQFFFSKFFKNHTGLNPSEYKRAI
jgi:AraC family transcriptional regulator, transcriptional activator of pobA